MRFISAEEIDKRLTFPALVDALRHAFAGGVVTPARHHHAIGEGPDHATMLLMPAWTGGAPGEGAFLGAKIVNVFPGNGTRGLPAVLGVYVLMSGETGAPLSALDGTRLTHWRTAAASALAASYLARPDARRLAVVGAGALAPFLVRAHADTRPIEAVSVWNHRPESGRALAERLQAEGFDARFEADLEAAVRGADIVSCATLSKEPLVKGAWLRPGTHLDLVGAFNLSMREADDEAVRRAAVFVDTESALTEGGDVALALLGQAIHRRDVRANLFDLARGAHAGRADPNEITLFKSVGTALEDLAAAVLVWHMTAEHNL
jgi:ornithine cyclodeaminase